MILAAYLRTETERYRERNGERERESWTGNMHFFFCTLQVEDSMHCFIQCLITHQILGYISQIWQVFSSC